MSSFVEPPGSLSINLATFDELGATMLLIRLLQMPSTQDESERSLYAELYPFLLKERTASQTICFFEQERALLNIVGKISRCHQAILRFRHHICTCQ